MGRVKRAMLLLLLAGCSSFDRDFEDRTVKHTMWAEGGLAGHWEGTWHSDVTGHVGGLRCIITGKGGDYSSRYHATYGFCIFQFSFEYTIPSTAVAQGDAWLLRGSAFLDSWIASGLYEYEARVERDQYVASYRSSFDSGIFRMKRVR
jgi:hypothetical protein